MKSAPPKELRRASWDGVCIVVLLETVNCIVFITTCIVRGSHSARTRRLSETGEIGAPLVASTLKSPVAEAVRC